jgi:hypothetical protein
MPEKTLEELICLDDPGWPEVQEWIAEAKNHVEVLPASDPARSEALLETQVTTRSIMGTIVYETGGLLIDHGWLRILGSGHEKLKRTMPQWTLEATGIRLHESPEILIGDDVLGGFYAMYADDEGLRNHVSYLAPDTLAWENMGLTYSEFIYSFCLHGDLEAYYSTLRWSGWQAVVAEMHGDQCLSITPPLWFKSIVRSERVTLEKREKKPVPALDAYHFALDIGAQLADVPDGATVVLKDV